MTRWAPDAQGRLACAAFELFAERGYEQATVAEIAERAGLTERTFFRYFADKREVLFLGSGRLQVALRAALAQAPDGLGPLDAVVHALAAAEAIFLDRERSRIRRGLIVDNDELRERELIKLAALSGAFALGLRERGVAAPTAALAADAGVAIFHAAFERWVAPGQTASYAALLEAAHDDLRAVTA